MLSKAFSAPDVMNMCFISFTVFIWWITLTDFCMLNHPCILGYAYLIMVDNLFDVFLVSNKIVASILLSIFASVFIRGISL